MKPPPDLHVAGEDHAAFVARVCKWARQVVAECGEFPGGMLYVCGDRGAVGGISPGGLIPPKDSPFPRYHRMRHMGEDLGNRTEVRERIGPLRYVITVAEVWHSRFSRDGTPPTARPSEDPRADDALSVADFDVVTRTGNMWLFFLRRDRRGRVVGTHDVEHGEPGHFGSDPLMMAFVEAYEAATHRRN